MRALNLVAPRTARVIDVPEPSPGVGEALVRVHACGVCGSDLNAWRGVPGVEFPLPTGAPGHEVVGEVIATDDGVRGVQVGDTVTGVMFNGFAEMAVARAEHLVSIPKGQPEVLGEPLACAMNVVRRARITAGGRVAVVGFGYLAALIVQLLPGDMGEWIAVSRREDSRALAQRLGAVATYDFEHVPSEQWDSFDVVIEAAGVQQTLDYATWLTAYGGRLVIAGYHADGPRTVNMQSWNWKGIDVINAHARQPTIYVEALRHALELIAARSIDPTVLQTHAVRLERAADAFGLAESRPPGFVKAVVCP